MKKFIFLVVFLLFSAMSAVASSDRDDLYVSCYWGQTQLDQDYNSSHFEGVRSCELTYKYDGRPPLIFERFDLGTALKTSGENFDDSGLMIYNIRADMVGYMAWTSTGIGSLFGDRLNFRAGFGAGVIHDKVVTIAEGIRNTRTGFEPTWGLRVDMIAPVWRELDLVIKGQYMNWELDTNTAYEKNQNALGTYVGVRYQLF